MNPATSLSKPRARRGSAFITVIMFVCVMFILCASILSWSLTERRLNMRNAYWLEARYSAEALAEYGFSQVVTAYNSYANPQSFDPGGSTPLVLPPTSFFSGGHVTTSAYSSSNAYGMELMASQPTNVPSTGSLYYVDPNNPDNQFDTLKGQYVYRRDVQVIARATVVPPIGQPLTAFVTENVSIRGAPLFANAVFYSDNDLEASPGPTLDIYGPVHVNGNMFPSAQGTVEVSTANAVNFHGPVSITGNLYHAWGSEKPSAEGRGYSSSSSTLDGEPLGNDPVTFVNSAGTQVNLQVTSTGVWKDSTMGADSSLLTSLGRYTSTATSAISQLETKLDSTFRQYAAQTWNGNVQTAAMGVAEYHPISFTQPIDAAGDLPDPHSIIDPPNTTLVTTDPYYSAKHEVENQKLANQSGLYVQVSVTPGTAGAADTATVTLYGPPGSAPTGTAAANIGPNGGIKLGTVPTGLVSFIPFQATASGTTSTPASQVSYSTASTGSGSSKRYALVTTTSTGGSVTATGSVNLNGTGTISNVSGGSYSGGSSSTSTGSYTYTTSAAALTAAPGGGATVVTPTGTAATAVTSTSSATVTSGMYDQRQLTGINLVQLDMGALNAALTDTNNNSITDGKAIKDASGAVWGGSSSASGAWNGGVYVEVKSSAGTYPGQTSLIIGNATVASGSSLLPTVNSVSGVTVTTNAPLYILGNMNADGLNATTASSATTPDDGKTDAAGTATSAQIPVALAADAITILSPNFFGTGSGTKLVPTSNGSGTSAYSSYTGSVPNASGSSEIAAAFITGIVATSATSFSGGLHNLPRFLETWGSNAVAIRGSLVALYNSKTATGPWAQRYYGAPKRIWGFDQIFQNGHFPPLTPKVMSYRRVMFRDFNHYPSQTLSELNNYLSTRAQLWPTRYSYP